MLKSLMTLLVCIVVAGLLLFSIPAQASEPVMDPITVEKIYNAQEAAWDYIYSFDYQRTYDYTGPIFDWHAELGTWTPGEITIIPPENWSGSWQGGSYGCETNDNPFTYGNMYLGAWTIRVKPGYGDGETTFYFTNWPDLPDYVGQQLNVLVPVVPEPQSLMLLTMGVGFLARMLIKRQM